MITLTLPTEEDLYLDLNLGALSETMGVLIAEQMKDTMARYPPYTPRKTPGKTYYERGSGSIYVKVSGGVTKYKNSENLGRKWDVLPSEGKTVLRNKASYSAYVHMASEQNRIHTKRNWKTEEDALEAINIAEIYDIARQALSSSSKD